MGLKNRNEGRQSLTWPDLMLLVPKWLIALAAVGIVALIALGLFGLKEKKSLGILGEWGPVINRDLDEVSLPEILAKYLSRTWQDVTSHRSRDKFYTNEEDYPIEISIIASGLRGAGDAGNPCDVQIWIDNLLIIQARDNSQSWARHCDGIATVPSGSSYVIKMDAAGHGSGTLLKWHELR